MAEESLTLPAHYYYDPEIYAKEKEEIWFKTWQYICSEQELSKPGDFFTAMVLDQPVVVTRDRSNKIRAFYNVCKHRGHMIVEGSGCSRTLRCPFHAWTYSSEGALISAPNSENIEGFDFDDFRLSEIRVEQMGFMIFVNLDDDAPSLAEMSEGVIDEIRETIPNFDDLKLVRKDSFDLDANWKFILDGLECYHCPYIHPHVMGKEDSYMTQTFDSKERTYGSTHIGYGNYELMEKHKDKLPYPFDDDTLRDITIWFLWPNLIFVCRPGPSNFQILQAFPDGPEKSHRNMINFCLNDPPTKYDLGHMDSYRDVAWPQDKKAMEMQAIGVKSRGYVQGRLMVDAEHSWRSEHGTHHFQNLVWKALHGDSY
ncbi:MAG: aromatic ring-hydroxylating dioxygenase subunit alpha [Novosphingobium sp.]